MSKSSFLQAVLDVGYTDCAKVKRGIEQLNKNPFFNQFFADLSLHLKQDCVITTQQLNQYDELVEKKNVLELTTLSEALRYEKHQQKITLQKHQQLQKELRAAQKRCALIEQQLQTLDDIYTETVENEDNLQEIAKSSLSALEQSRGHHKCAVERCSGALCDLNRDCETAYMSYKNKSNQQCLVSLVDLSKYLSCESDYKSELTLYARKLFEDVQVVEEDWNSELHSAADTILLGGGDREMKEDILGDLKRATMGYESRKKRMIVALAKLEKSSAVDKFLLNKRKSISFNNPSLNKSCLESLKYAIETTVDQSSYLLRSVLPGLLLGGAPKVKNLVLTGDFKQKLIKQRKIRENQKLMIDLLSQQCSRLTLVWMLLFLEHTRTEILSKKLENVSSVMTKNVEFFSSSLNTFESIPQINHFSKERKAVIDKRDSTMLHLHKLLVAEEASSGMFKTFKSVREAANSSADQQRFRLPDSIDVALSNSVRELYWKHTDPRDGSGRIMLSSPAIRDGLKRLHDAVSEAKTSVPKLLTAVDKKRAFLQNNQEARRAKTLWMEFILTALALKGAV